MASLHRRPICIWLIASLLFIVTTCQEEESFLNSWLQNGQFPDISWVRTLDRYNPLDRPDQSKVDKNGNKIFAEYDDTLFNAIATGDIESLNSWKANSTDQCLAALMDIIIGLSPSSKEKPMYLLPMLDSMGKIPSGVTAGSIVWPGYFRQCVELPPLPDIPGGNKSSTKVSTHKEVKGRYCSIQLGINISSSLPLPQIPVVDGICVPHVCSGEDIGHHVRMIGEMLGMIPGLSPILKHVSVNSVYCHPRPEERHLDAAAIGCILVFVTFLVLVIIGTFVEVTNKRCSLIEDYKNLQKKDILSNDDSPSPPLKKELGEGSSSTSEDGNEEIPDDGIRRVEEDDENLITQQNNNSISFNVGGDEVVVPSERSIGRRSRSREIFVKFFSSFSIVSNLNHLLTVKQRPDDVSCLHGIRFLSMAWVVLCHNYVFPIAMVSNLLDYAKDSDLASFFWILNGSFNVDSFFVMSGLLLGYLFFKDEDPASMPLITNIQAEEGSDLRTNRPLSEKVKSAKFWLMYYFHRFWRLLPTYAVILFFDARLAQYAGSGPFWDYGDTAASEKVMCGKTWWKNLLFVNNFINVTEECMAWTWYLANDMQFYVISPIFLLLLLKSRKLGYSLIFITIVASVTLTGGITYRFNINGGFISIAQSMTQQAVMDYLVMIYSKPWTRIPPYLIGMVTGLLLREKFVVRKLSVMSTPWRAALWALTFTILGATLYSPLHIHMTLTGTAFYNALSRTSWAIGLSILILMATSSNTHKKYNGEGVPSAAFASIATDLNVVNKILSWSLLVPLSRLTYCAYLIHPIIMMYVYRSLQSGIRYTTLVMVGYYVSAMTIVYIASAVIHLLIEAPFVRLEMAFLRRSSK